VGLSALMAATGFTLSAVSLISASLPEGPGGRLAPPEGAGAGRLRAEELHSALGSEPLDTSIREGPGSRVASEGPTGSGTAGAPIPEGSGDGTGARAGSSESSDPAAEIGTGTGTDLTDGATGSGWLTEELLAPPTGTGAGPGHQPGPDGAAGEGTLTPAAVQLDPVELEILELTNSLRADPSGLLARSASLPACVDNPFYDITIDPDSGQPEPVPPLVLDEQVSLSLSRSWAQEMDRTGRFEHRSSGSAVVIYGHLGIELSATGENIAWMSGYPESEAARVHFEGWRESDAGHYCALISPTYTHIGVGAHQGEERSWAVQSYYRRR
jgi:hypothetical protein